ncbi:hypothetical protein [Actinopolymorpha pittospori]|uniref:Uncharacterized protein n=1 Tax=Actinopolymorpha pittospori TaxID=648752 RepID=A0A927MR81_9ACTN|nr:hypothetical protein [Actinopolymorpha pittospori]MBE1604871.1 hypothetical protein [Actinopolymorpha pittospori]
MNIDYTQRVQRLARIRLRAEVARRRAERLRSSEEPPGGRSTGPRRRGADATEPTE